MGSNSYSTHATDPVVEQAPPVKHKIEIDQPDLNFITDLLKVAGESNPNSEQTVSQATAKRILNNINNQII